MPETDLFQFHKGAIKTLVDSAPDSTGAGFNSIKVRLKLTILALSLSAWASFNSIKVRLKPRDARAAALGTDVFQFHKGAIKTVSFEVSAIRCFVSIP